MYTASLFIDLPELELRGVEDARPTPRLHWRIRSRRERWNARSFLRATLASPIFGSSASHSLILRNSPHRRPIDRFCFFLPSFLSLFSPPPFDFFPLCLSPSSAFGQKFIIFSFSSTAAFLFRVSLESRPCNFTSDRSIISDLFASDRWNSNEINKN